MSEWITSKKQADVYKLRERGGFAWADITIDSYVRAESDGRVYEPFRISIASDYGFWQFFWSHPGSSWRKFCNEIGIYYAAGKFGAKDWYDESKSENHLLENIVIKRREGCSSKDEARLAYHAVKAVFSDVGGNYDLVFERLTMESGWMEFWGDGWYDQFYKCTSVEPGFKAFWDEIWPKFLDMINMEVKEDAA